MVFFKKILFLISIIATNIFFYNAFASSQIDFLICSSTENKSQYAVIERNTIYKKSFEDNSDNSEVMINNLAPFFLSKGYYIPDFCGKVDLEKLTNEFPYLSDKINQYLAMEDNENNENPLIVVLPHHLTSADSINKVRPVIIATSLTFALLWGLGSSYLAPGCLMIFITCAFRPEQCQTVLENFYNFFAELWAKATTRQFTPMTGTGHRLGD